MNIPKIKYEIKKANFNDIYWHLTACDDNFTPPLSARVTIQDYAIKIFDKAVTFEAWTDDILVGLIAAYFNDPDNIIGYITNVSTLNNYMRLGIAGELMKACIEYARQHGFDQISLEVNSSNDSAIYLYRKYAFDSVSVENGFLQMKVIGLKSRETALS